MPPPARQRHCCLAPVNKLPEYSGHAIQTYDPLRAAAEVSIKRKTLTMAGRTRERVFVDHEQKGMKLHQARPRFRMRPLFGRLTAGAAAILSLVLCTSLLAASPALADGSSHSLSWAAGHTCKEIPIDAFYDGVLCADMGFYVSSLGPQYITLEVQAFCRAINTATGYVPCNEADITGTVANGAGNLEWTTHSCAADCQNGRTFFYPFYGLSIAPGACDYNVWGSVQGGNAATGSRLWMADFDTWNEGYITQNFATPHFNVCENLDGSLHATAV